MNKVYAISAALVVGIAVISGLYLGGSPGEQRLYRFDERRVEDLQILSRAIQRRWDKKERLPQALVELVDGQRLANIPLDPASDVEYVYEPASINTYRLCANFSRPSVNPRPGDFWMHGTGYQCFDFTLVSKEESKASGTHE